MTSTPNDAVPASALAGPDWAALEDELAPICDELAARYAALYDPARRRSAYLTHLRDIRARDEQQRVERETARQAAARAAVEAAVRAASIEAGFSMPGLETPTSEASTTPDTAPTPRLTLLPAWS